MDHSAVPPNEADTPLDVVVVGAGQAGLATAYHLRRHRVRFLVVDAAPALGHAWRTRWDSLRLFTPAEHDGLPGFPFPAPRGTYPGKDTVAAYLEAYARRFDVPVLLDCTVASLTRREDGVFELRTTRGVLRARQVVVATGPFQRPVVPAWGAHLSVPQLHSADYRRPSDLPAGPALVVGAGNSGRQIALELAASRPVTLAVGTAALELPQRPLGRDLFWWLTRLGAVTRTADSPVARRMRARGDLVIGTPLSRLRRAGVDVRPRATSAVADEVRFEEGPPVRPSAVVWATGYRADHHWIDVPGALVEGVVAHRRGLTDVPGLAFVGLPWQHTRGSSLLGFVQHDAAWVVDQLVAGTRRSSRRHPVVPVPSVSNTRTPDRALERSTR